MSSENVTRTSLYSDRLKIFEWMKLLKRHLRQIHGNWAGRNFLTASRFNSLLITHARMQRWIWATSTNGFIFRIINSLMGSWGVRFTWLDCKNLQARKLGKAVGHWVVVKLFPRATIHDMKSHIIPTIEKSPDQICLHIGSLRRQLSILRGRVRIPVTPKLFYPN